jgi:hypothetical protein
MKRIYIRHCLQHRSFFLVTIIPACYKKDCASCGKKSKEMIVASDPQTTQKKKLKKTTKKEKKKENTSRLSQQQQQRSGVVCGGLLLAPLSISLRWVGRSGSPKDGSASFACLCL